MGCSSSKPVSTRDSDVEPVHIPANSTGDDREDSLIKRHAKAKQQKQQQQQHKQSNDANNSTPSAAANAESAEANASAVPSQETKQDPDQSAAETKPARKINRPVDDSLFDDDPSDSERDADDEQSAKKETKKETAEQIQARIMKETDDLAFSDSEEEHLQPRARKEEEHLQPRARKPHAHNDTQNVPDHHNHQPENHPNHHHHEQNDFMLESSADMDHVPSSPPQAPPTPPTVQNGWGPSQQNAPSSFQPTPHKGFDPERFRRANQPGNSYNSTAPSSDRMKTQPALDFDAYNLSTDPASEAVLIQTNALGNGTTRSRRKSSFNGVSPMAKDSGDVHRFDEDDEAMMDAILDDLDLDNL